MKLVLQCTGGKFVPAETCKGPGACKVAANGEIACDNDIADVNDPCRDKGDYACTSDKSNALQCANSKMGLVNTCRGPGGCKIIHLGKNVDIDCDMSVVQENDPCVIPDNEGCSLDKKTRLTCSGADPSVPRIGKYTNAVSCPGPNGCSVHADKKNFKVTCDTSAGGGGEKSEKKKGKKR